jgi:ATP-binding cassette subfamily F protein 3
VITLSSVYKQFGSKILFNNISVSINPKNRTGLIGRNGTGKTILLKILTEKEDIDSGDICIPADLKIGYLPQEIGVDRSISPLDLVLEPFYHLLNNESVIDKIASCKDIDSQEYKKAVEKFDSFSNELDIYNAHSLPSRAKSILAGLGVPYYSWDKDISNLSGGYHMRVLLAQLLLTEPDFLLLDEPTNHLDMDSLIWLEKYLQKFKGGMLIVSHDRDFLNRITKYTMEISGSNITQFSGNIEMFLAWKEEYRSSEERRVKNLQNKILQTEQFISRFKSKNTKASQARSKMKQLERLKEKLPENRSSLKAIHFNFPKPLRSGSVPVKFENVSVSYSDINVLNNISFNINRGDKIAVIGPNGAGKSTLLKTCFGTVKQNEGTVQTGHNTNIKYFSQHRLEHLDSSKTVLETVADTMGVCDKPRIQSLLGAFLFSSDDIYKQVKYLSGGEKSRLSLAIMLIDPGNVLLLDEPTNHLDMQSTECLSDALTQFSGTILVVSHDEYFISRISNRIFEIRRGVFRDFPGTVSDYRLYVENGYCDTESLPSKNNTKTSNKETEKEVRMRIRQEKKKIERLITIVEKNILNIENEIGQLNKILHEKQNESNYQKLAEINLQINEKKEAYDELLDKWEILHQDLEDITNR